MLFRSVALFLVLCAILSAYTEWHSEQPTLGAWDSYSTRACQDEADTNYADCMQYTKFGPNYLYGGPEDQSLVAKGYTAHINDCGEHNESVRQHFMAYSGYDVGTCDCEKDYTRCLLNVWNTVGYNYEKQIAEGQKCSPPAMACYKAFMDHYCPTMKAEFDDFCANHGSHSGTSSQGTGTSNTGTSNTGGTSTSGSVDPCANVNCDKEICQNENGKSVWYSGGTCVKGKCQYNALDCKLGCNAKNDGCKQEIKVDVFLMEPYDNQRVDSKGGPATVGVVGIARGASEAGASNVMVSVPGVLMPASISMSGDRFSGTVDLPGPGKYVVKVEARGSDGSILSSAESNVEVGASFVDVVWQTNSARLVMGGKETTITSDQAITLQEGDELTILKDNGAYIEYSDGTQALLNEGVTMRKGKGGAFTILRGNLQINGNFAHEFDTRFGDVVMKGTSFTIDVDDFRTRVSVSKGAVGLFSLYDSVGTVQAGQYGDIMRNGTINVYSGDGAVVETSNPTGRASAMDPSTHTAAGCCGAAFILAVVAGFSMRRASSS
jgi:hypothetical protein